MNKSTWKFITFANENDIENIPESSKFGFYNNLNATRPRVILLFISQII